MRGVQKGALRSLRVRIGAPWCSGVPTQLAGRRVPAMFRTGKSQAASQEVPGPVSHCVTGKASFFRVFASPSVSRCCPARGTGESAKTGLGIWP